MYSCEERIRAVELYIKLGKRVRVTPPSAGLQRQRPPKQEQGHESPDTVDGAPPEGCLGHPDGR